MARKIRNGNNGTIKEQRVKCIHCDGTGEIVLKDINAFFGYHIRQLRDKKGITQAQMAEQMGMSRTGLVNLEAGRRRISLNQIHAIASILNISIKDLF